jgi:hypothetical protein
MTLSLDANGFRDPPHLGAFISFTARVVPAVLGVLIGIALVAWSTLAAAADDEQSTAVLRAIAEGNLQNRESFEQFVCRFRVSLGTAPTLEHALRGDSISVAATADGVWIVDSPAVCFDLKCDPALIEQAMEKAREQLPASGGTVAGPPLPSKGFLDDGRHQLMYSRVLKGGNVFQPDNRTSGISLGPFDMGAMGVNEAGIPGRVILESFSTSKPAVLEGPLGLVPDGLVSVTVRSTSHEADSWKRSFVIDPQRGCLPVEIRYYGEDGGSLVGLAVMTDAKECTRGRWFPMRSIAVLNPSSVGDTRHVREIVVTSLDVDTSPPPQEFSIAMEAGSLINDPSVSGSQMAIREPRSINVTELAELSDSLRRRASDRRANVRPVEGAYPKWLSGVLWWMGGLGIVLVVLFFARRFRGTPS